MYRTEDVHFAAWLHQRQIGWSALERNPMGRSDFVFDLAEEEANRLRVQFANSPEARYASSLDFVNRVVQDARRNRGGAR